jgi:hypothetical protein
VAGTAGGFEMKEFLKSRLEGFYVPDVFLPWPAAVPEEDAKVNFELFRRLAIERRL